MHMNTCVDTHAQVAIKRMKRKYYSWDECMQLREVKVRCLMPLSRVLCQLDKCAVCLYSAMPNATCNSNARVCVYVYVCTCVCVCSCLFVNVCMFVV
jgi:hypothetical protein